MMVPVLQTASKVISAEEVAYKADMAAIKATLLAWQEAKQAAMGSTHDIKALESVLEGNMLQQWRTRANHINKINWHWRYQIDKITVRCSSLLNF
jgi:hypothetical protein